MNIIKYLETYFEDFSAAPLTDVDSLVLSQFSYVCLAGFVGTLETGEQTPIESLLRAENFSKLYTDTLFPENNKLLTYALAASPRFRGMKICCFDEKIDTEKEEQFCAMCFLLPDGSVYVAFRGTDITFLGWKEDFNMAYVCPVPAQTTATQYLDTIAERFPDAPLYVGGHSKGGNLAVYAAMACSDDTTARLRAVYSHDGPGFQPQVIASEPFVAVMPLVHKTLPQSSMIGMLLQSHEPYTVVKSSESTGILQHDSYSWEIENGAFVVMENLTASAQMRNTTLDTWLSSLSDDTRRAFVDALFDVVNASGAKTLSEFSNSWKTHLPAMLKKLASLDAEAREALGEAFAAFGAATTQTLFPQFGAKTAQAEKKPALEAGKKS